MHDEATVDDVRSTAVGRHEYVRSVPNQEVLDCDIRASGDGYQCWSGIAAICIEFCDKNLDPCRTTVM